MCKFALQWSNISFSSEKKPFMASWHKLRWFMLRWRSLHHWNSLHSKGKFELLPIDVCFTCVYTYMYICMDFNIGSLSSSIYYSFGLFPSLIHVHGSHVDLAAYGLENSPSLSLLQYMIQSRTFMNMLQCSTFLFELNSLCCGTISELFSFSSSVCCWWHCQELGTLRVSLGVIPGQSSWSREGPRDPLGPAAPWNLGQWSQDHKWGKQL